MKRFLQKSGWSNLLKTILGTTCSLFFFLVLFLAPTAPAIIDENENGLSDLWEKSHNDNELFPPTYDPQADADQDGWTNAQEADAGTDPAEPNPPDGHLQPEITDIPAVYYDPNQDGIDDILTPETLIISWPTIPGKLYTLHTSPDLDVWLPIPETYIGTGNIIEYKFPLTQPDRMFWRVAITDTDTDGDSLTDAEESQIGSSRYLADTDGNGIDDAAAVAAGMNPAGDGTDADGDGVPDNELYSVVFEIRGEYQDFIHTQVAYEALDGTDNLHRYLTREESEEYAVTDSPRYPDVTNGIHKFIDTHLDNGAIPYPALFNGSEEGTSLLSWQNSNLIPDVPGQTILDNTTQQTVTVNGPTIGATEIVTTATTSTPWEIKAGTSVVDSGTETQVVTNRIKLLNEVTYPQFWADYVKPRGYRVGSPNRSGPLNRSYYMEEVDPNWTDAESLREAFIKGDFSVPGTISEGGSYYHIPDDLGSNCRLNRARWRWVRFNPLNPFAYEYAAPPAAYVKRFNFLVVRRDFLDERAWDGAPPLIDETIPKGVIEIECLGNKGTNDWEEIPLATFNSFKVEDPTNLALFDFSKQGLTTVSFGNLTVSAAVDANRDGKIEIGKEFTSAQKPFRFWINNDQDDVENDEPIVVNNSDALDGVINSKRDLEDFTRLKVEVGDIAEKLRTGEMQIGLKFKNTSTPKPRIRIWESKSDQGDLLYLEDGGAAAAQCSLPTLGETYSTVMIPRSYWLLHDDSTTAHLIFEGTGTGSGQLTVSIQNEAGVEIGEVAGPWIKLLDVREMYRRARIENEPEEIDDPWVNQNPPAQTWVWDDWDWPYSEDPDAKPVTAVLVHGWRLKYMDFMNWSDTSYKRLWHQGFKGKFYSFRWATFSGDNNGLPYGLDEQLESHTDLKPGGLTYNASEYRAWLCGSALADFVNQLPDPPSRRNLFAHSMGNVIAGVALRNGMKVKNYALCNAAMAAMTYDPNSALKNDPNTGNELSDIFFGLEPHKTPDTDPDPSIRELYGLQDQFYDTNIPNKPTMFNFGLPDDSALGSWTANNLHFKPDGDGHSYYYQEIPQPPNLSYKLFQVPPNANPREVASQPEAMGFVTKAITRTAGADLRTRGSIGASQNMNDWGPGAAHAGFGATHSAVWRWNNQSTHLFWEKLVEVLQLKPQQP